MHPALEKSRVNHYVIDSLKGLDYVTIQDLYQHYPEFDIDVKKEQQLLIDHEIIVFHFPLFWYSTPAILKEWQDLVLEHDWAYGHKGNALKDKYFFCFLTTGGKGEAYCNKGYNFYTISEFLVPLERTAKLCKMNYLPPYVVHGTHSITKEKIEMHKVNYRNVFTKICDDSFNCENLKQLDYMNKIFKQEEVK